MGRSEVGHTLRTGRLPGGIRLLAAALALFAWGCAEAPPGKLPPPPGTTAVTCRRASSAKPLSGERIRLAAALEAADLEVRPVRLGPSLSRRLVDRGWDLKRARRAPGEPTLLIKSPATLRLPPSPCTGGPGGAPGGSAASAWIRLAGAGGGGIPERMGLAVSSAGAPPVASALREGGRSIWLEAPLPAGSPSGAVVIEAERNSEVGLAAVQLPLGRLRIGVEHESRDAIVGSSVRRAAFRVVLPAGARLRFALGLAAGDEGSGSGGAGGPGERDPLGTEPAGEGGGPDDGPGSGPPRDQASGWEHVIRGGPAGSVTELFRERVAEERASGARPWLERSVDLSRWEGEEIVLALETGPVGAPESLALWGSPVIEGSPGEAAPHPSILLISLDTLRADRLGRASGGHLLTPEMDRLAQDAALFTGCRTQAPSTLYGHGAMLTGLPPAAHGATTKSVLPPGIPYLPEILAREGYTTVALTDDGLLDGRYGFDRGFDRFRSVSEAIEGKVDLALEALDGMKGPWLLLFHSYTTHVPYAPPPEFASLFLEEYAGPLGEDVDARHIKKTVSWMNQGRIPVREEDLRRLESLYNGEVRRADHAVGRILRWLRQRGLYDSTIVVVTSDHGEELDEHGVVAWHSLTCYEELMRVPLIIKPARRPGAAGSGNEGRSGGTAAGRTGGQGPSAAGAAGARRRPTSSSGTEPPERASRGDSTLPAGSSGRRVETAVRTIDIAPTVLELAGLDPHAAMSGRTLTGLMAGREEPDRTTLCEVEDARGAAILHEGWKYHMRADWSVDDPRTPRRRLQQRGRYGAEELYHLPSDPGEQVNLMESHPERGRALRAMLQESLREATLIQASLTRDDPAARIPLEDAEHLERLRALGYVD